MLRAKPLPALADFPAAVLDALARPLGTPPLSQLARPGQRVVVVVNDATRLVRSREYLPVLVSHLHSAGVKDENIALLVATGAHRPATTEELVELVGADLLARVRVENHRAEDGASMVEVGITSRGTPVRVNRLAAEADLLVLTGGITFHYLAGFSGGRKSLVPGVSALETIRANHRLVLEAGDTAGPGKLDGNPVSEDMTEGAALVKPAFLFNVVLNDAGEAAGVFAGHWCDAHRAGCAMVAESCGVRITRPARRVVASAGGYPKDINLYQAFKGLYTAMQAVEEGGEVVFLAECRDGTGEDEFYRFACQDMPDHLKEETLRREFSIARYAGYLNSRWSRKANIKLVSSLPENKVRAMGMLPCRSLEEVLEQPQETGEAIDDLWIIPHAATVSLIDQ